MSRARRGGAKAESPQGKDFHHVTEELVSGKNFGLQIMNARDSVGLRLIKVNCTHKQRHLR